MRLMDYLVPQTCVFCGEWSEADEKSICCACLDDLPWNEPVVSTAPGIFESSIAVMRYSFPIDVAIKALKFNRRLYYAPAFCELLCMVEKNLPHDVDAVLPVPLHWRRKMTRGFNQATELARPIAKILAVPIVSGVTRYRSTPFQSGLNAVARAGNLRRAFRATRRLKHRHILIVDDVITTGATTQALAELLQSTGVEKVSVLAVARAG